MSLKEHVLQINKLESEKNLLEEKILNLRKHLQNLTEAYSCSDSQGWLMFDIDYDKNTVVNQHGSVLTLADINNIIEYLTAAKELYK